MPELLGAANRVPGYDNANANRTQLAPTQPGHEQVQNVVDPTRVVRADGRGEQQENNSALQYDVKRFDSNFQTFLEQLRQSTQLTQSLNQTIVLLRGVISTPGLQAGVAQEISQVLEMLRMDAQEFRKLFMQQVHGGNRLSGALFDALRQACRQSWGQRGQEAILDFVRRYMQFSSARHIGNNMMALLRQMPDYLPGSWREQLVTMSAQLEQGLAAGERGNNLALLQNKIVPYLARYVERAHDLGPLRSLLNLLSLNIAQYEQADPEKMLQAFRRMEGYSQQLSGLNRLDDGAIMRLLTENQFTQAGDSAFVQGFAHMAGQALKGEYGPDVRQAFAEIIHALLIQESVYMPLNHMMFPVEWNGKMMYSELWVDPNAQEQQDGFAPDEGKRTQFLLKMDLEGLGFIEMSMAVVNGRVQMHVYGPEEVSHHGATIARDLTDILADHQLTGSDVHVSKLETPLALSQVFPNLFEGRQGINVKI